MAWIQKRSWPSDVIRFQSFGMNFRTKNLTLILSFNIEHKIPELTAIKFSKYKLSTSPLHCTVPSMIPCPGTITFTGRSTNAEDLLFEAHWFSGDHKWKFPIPSFTISLKAYRHTLVCDGLVTNGQICLQSTITTTGRHTMHQVNRNIAKISVLMTFSLLTFSVTFLFFSPKLESVCVHNKIFYVTSKYLQTLNKEMNTYMDICKKLRKMDGIGKRAMFFFSLSLLGKPQVFDYESLTKEHYK